MARIDVPFHIDKWNPVAYGIHIGGIDYATGMSLRTAVVRDEFDLVVSCFRRPGAGPDQSVPHYECPIPDGVLDIEGEHHVLDAALLVLDAAGHGKRTLVRCQAGYNRSALIVATTLMMMEMTAQQAIDLVRICRSPYALFNESFVDLLHHWDHQRPWDTRGTGGSGG